MMAKVAVVTGANKGIGYQIVRGLRQQLDPGSTIYLGSRDLGRGQAAKAQIEAERSSLAPTAESSPSSAPAPAAGPLAEVRVLQLDLTDEASMAAAAAELRRAHPDGIDILVNNAGFAFKAAAAEPAAVQAKVTLGVNYFGTLRVCEHLVPLLRPPYGRVVNVGSMAGGLGSWSQVRNIAAARQIVGVCSFLHYQPSSACVRSCVARFWTPA